MIQIILLLPIAAFLYVAYRRSGTKIKIVEMTLNIICYGIANLAGIAEDLMTRRRNRLHHPKFSRGKVAIVTGGSRGIGAEVSKILFPLHYHVILAVRNVKAGEEFVTKMKNESVKVMGCTIEVMELDVSSMKSVKKFSEEVKKRHPKIHLLVNNAGILFHDFELTEDGFETQLATNYLGHFYLTHLLMDNLKRAGEESNCHSRVVNVSSCIHYFGEIWFDDINMEKCHDPVGGYARTKLAQLMFTRHASKLFKAENLPVNIYAVNPGLVSTGMFYDTPVFKPVFWIGKILKTPEQGAVSVLHCCVSDIEDKSGAYISNCDEGVSNSFSKNVSYQEHLFDLTCKMLKIEKFGH